MADFDNISIACTEFVILEDKLAFEEVESFNISLLPLETSEEFLAQLGENTSATVEISDNDCKLLGFSLCLSLLHIILTSHTHACTCTCTHTHTYAHSDTHTHTHVINI